MVNYLGSIYNFSPKFFITIIKAVSELMISEKILPEDDVEKLPKFIKKINFEFV